ncbi:MAG: hypothetical protein KF709_07620 [Gemmatimonadaceae bacterium]|nr:hypothetical protein [Gemmatimonadaceae bacterium]
MPARTLQLQIRVTPQQKAALRARARAAGVGMSEYVLARVLPESRDRFRALVAALANTADARAVLAELNEMLTGLSASELAAAVEQAELRGLSLYLANYLAAMVEKAADRKRVMPPAWTRRVEPLESPHFASSLVSLRPHLLRNAPVPFKRRNIFVDASIGDRV